MNAMLERAIQRSDFRVKSEIIRLRQRVKELETEILQFSSMLNAAERTIEHLESVQMIEANTK